MTGSPNRPPAAPPRLRVLLSVPRPGPKTNPYVTQLVDAVADDVEMLPFSWSTALRERVDVVHLHWPENLVRRPRLASRLARAVLLRAALRRWRRQRVPIVRTVHNLRPHEAPPFPVGSALDAVDAQTTLAILLNAETPPVLGIEQRVIPHGDYLPWLAAHPIPPREPGRLLDFGLVRRYKNIPALLDAFAAVDADGLRLQIAGSVDDAGLADQIRAAARRDPRVELELRFVPDAELATAIGRAQLVVLPYSEMHNSGALLLALSVGRPVLVPRNAVTDALAAEVGEPWVLRYDGAVTTEVLREAVAASAGTGADGAGPRLDARAWTTVAAAHVDAYRRAIRLAAERGGR